MWTAGVIKGFRPGNLELRAGELRSLVRRSREVVLLAAVTGAITGLLVRFFEYVVAEVAFHALLDADWRWGIIAPGVGLAASAILLHTVGAGASPATSDEYLRAFHDPEYPLRWRAFVGRLAAAFATLGSGGAMGLEGPSMYSGSAIGAMVQRRLPASFRGADYRTLLVAGAAAGVAAIFKAPATGAIFALEVPFRDQMARRMLLPALVASASGYLTFVALSSTRPIFSFADDERTVSLFQYVDLFGAILIGIGCAIGARLFSKLMRTAKAYTLRPVVIRIVVASTLLGALFLVTRILTADGWNPADGESLTLGSGYEVFFWLGEEQALWLLVAVFVLRMCATAATLAGGGVGGVFIPLVVGGALVGRIVGEVFNTVDPTLYVLLGIAAFLGAGYRVPLAAVMFVAETTGQPGFIVPALFAAVAADLVMGEVSITTFQRTPNTDT
ncbi:MAG: chloride channel protein [Ilumatobacter sp.]|uniref:chloride channel protein n=1 Tax=Ilumatobacter sp. TaxID=1967498 RepID=UPI00391B5D11